MHDADGISSHRSVKNFTLLRSRVEFQIKSFCFFHCLLDRGHFKHRTVTAFVYIMHEERPIGVPSDFYMDTCLEGYDTFYFDPDILLAAYEKSLEVCGYERE